MPLPPGVPRARRSWIREASANFWREFLYWWTEHWPPFVRVTRPFFLFFAFRFSEALRDGPAANARRILGPDADRRDVEILRRRIVRSAYTSIYELGRAVRSTPKQLCDWVERIDGTEGYQNARSERRGAILVTAHLGPFEIGASALVTRERQIHVLFQRDERASFDRLRSRLRARLGVSEAPLDEGWSVWVRLRDALLQDEVVLIQGDRVMPGQRGVPVSFMGGHLLMPTGPVKLAMMTGSPIIPIFSVRTRVGRCRVIIDEPIRVPRVPGPVTGAHPAMVHVARAIERQVRAHPDQWAMYERAWCEDRRPGEGRSLCDTGDRETMTS
jgi:KDO2-lipid IV(A) lauroyltransferase